MATAMRDVNMSNHPDSSSPEFSSLPSEPPSETGSPRGYDQRRTSFGRSSDEIVVDPSSASRLSLTQQQSAQQSRPLQASSLDGVRLTKEGVPRKKPGRKPGTMVKKAGDGVEPSTSTTATAAGSGVEAPKPKRVRKPKDPNAPPVPRKKRAQPTSTSGNEAGIPRSSSANIHFEPKLELTSMRMDIDSRPTPHPLGPSAILSSTTHTHSHMHPRKPPLPVADKAPKRESHQSSVMSILNVDDSPPRQSSHPAHTSTTPVRSVGQSYDPIRSTTSYDPVRETMLSRDPYGTGPLGSPRTSAQLANRASASPSIASLVDPAPMSDARSRVGSFSMGAQVSPPSMSIAAATSSSRYREHIPSLPPSPSPAPASSTIVVPTSASNPTPSSASTEPQTTLTSKLSMAKASAKSSTKGEANGNGKSQSKPPPPPAVPASAKTTTAKATTTKAAEKKAAAAAAKAAAAASKGSTTTKSTAATKAAAAKAAAKAAASPETSLSASDDTPAAKPSGPATTSFKDVAMSAATLTTVPPPSVTSAPHIKKFSSILQQERGVGGKQNKTATSAASSPKLSGSKGDSGVPSNLASLDASPQAAGSEPERSILDFGKALPGEEMSAPSIVLHIPLISGETNKYVNFMRMAEERYGWDALHPRLAAHRDRKLRIAAASAALERTGSGRESGDEMTDDMQSGDEGSNEENAAGNAENGTNGVVASGPDDAPAAAKPARKKRIFKEDEYDKDDDFVDDSEMLWEEQAAASRDGFFVYSGPLVPEEEKPAEGTTTPAKRGRGTRGGRGGTSRATAARATAGRGASGPGSRGGTTMRKPRITKQEKEQREREKAELEKASKSKDISLSAPFSSGMAIDDI